MHAGARALARRLSRLIEFLDPRPEGIHAPDSLVRSSAETIVVFDNAEDSIVRRLMQRPTSLRRHEFSSTT